MKWLFNLLSFAAAAGTLLLVSRGAQPVNPDSTRYLVLWRSINGSYWERPGWLGWWMVVDVGTIYTRGNPPY